MASLLFNTETVYHSSSVYTGTLTSGKTLKIKIELSKVKDKFSKAYIFKEDELRWICLVEDSYVIPKKNILNQSTDSAMNIEDNITVKNQEKTGFFFDCIVKLIS